MLLIRLQEERSAPPLHKQIADQILFQVEQGEVLPGARLPASRDLARSLGVARGTVVLAYEQLCEARVCVSRVGHGTVVIRSPRNAQAKPPPASKRERPFISPDEPVTLDPREVSLLPSMADTDYLPRTELRRAFDRVLRFPSHLRAFGESAGDPKLRKLICERILAERGIAADPAQVMVVPGTQYGSVLVAMALAKARRRVHFGAPGYLDIARNFGRFGFGLVSHPVDADGMRVPSSLGNKDVLYVMPEHHFPQCVSLSAERRAIVAAMSQDRDVMVIEDDYDSEYYYDRLPQPALKANDNKGNIVYLGTFSKTLFNNLRLGYLVANPSFIRELASLHWSLSRGTSGLLQRWVAELLDDGTLNRHVRRMRTVYRRKRDKIAEALRRDFPQWKFTVPRGGLQFFIEVRHSSEVDAMAALCESRKLRMASSANYVLADQADQANFLVIGFGSAPLVQILSTLSELKKAL